MNQSEFNELLNRMVVLFESGGEVRDYYAPYDARSESRLEQSRKLIPLISGFLEYSCITKKFANDFLVSDQGSIADLISVFSDFREIVVLDEFYKILQRIFEQTSSPEAKDTMLRLENMIYRLGQGLQKRIESVSDLLMEIIHKIPNGHFPEPERVREIIEKHERLVLSRWNDDVESFSAELKMRNPGDNPKFPINYPVTFFGPGDKIIKDIPRFIQKIIDETGTIRKQTRYETRT